MSQLPPILARRELTSNRFLTYVEEEGGEHARTRRALARPRREAAPKRAAGR